ncbi:MAG: pyridoxamine 5'-phosphate oxidase family protein [Bacteroidota bacterium]
METLDQILRQSWNLLFRGAVQARHPYHTPILVSTDGKNVHGRTVVLRKTIVEERQLWVYTDIRSDKISDFRQQPQASFVFWDKGKSIQLRTQATVDIHHQDDMSQNIWQNIPPKNRRDYVTLSAPGQPIKNPDEALPADWESKTAAAADNFALLIFTVHHIDYLHLSREEHTRASFVWKNGEWEQSFLVP